jgi:hypothetical protein
MTGWDYFASLALTARGFYNVPLPASEPWRR